MVPVLARPSRIARDPSSLPSSTRMISRGRTPSSWAAIDARVARSVCAPFRTGTTKLTPAGVCVLNAPS